MPTQRNVGDMTAGLKGPAQISRATMTHWSGHKPRSLEIAIINNMPDAALRRTEEQFTNLLVAAAEDLDLRLTFYSLPAIPRAESGRQYVSAAYATFDDLWLDPPDAMVVTGTEPHEENLRDEPYWWGLTALIDWADVQAIPTMFSCLAAHAAVLHLDNVRREPVGRKCFGLFDHEIVAPDHPFMEGVGARMWLPHSRWNQVTESALAAAGYQILSRGDEAGVGFFSRQHDTCMLFCQGHPEYDGANLLREYRRDIRRFLSRTRPNYPDLPHSYFAESDLDVLAGFRRRALAGADEDLMVEFPLLLGGPHWDAWAPSSMQIFRNWLLQAALRARGCQRETRLLTS